MSDADPAAPPPARPKSLLSLDGGGVRGLSELFILQAIMHGIQRAGNLDTEPLPADYFDLMCGTSTGGLIAILLGRLRLSVSQAIQKYGELSKYVFSEQKRGPFPKSKFKATRLEEAIKKVLLEELGEGKEEEILLEPDGTAGCKTCVCAVPAINVSTPRLFRSYRSTMPAYPAKIWQVARATSAAPRFFKSIKIGEKGMKEEFVDGGLGYNNPVKLAIQEAMDEFPSESRVACIVSIGTGRTKASGFTSPHGFRRILPLDLINVMKTMATDCEKLSEEMSEKYLGCPGLYHRLNVEVGLDDIALGEWDRLDQVKTHTMAYLESREMRRRIQGIVEVLLGRVDTTYPLNELDGRLRNASITTSTNESPFEYFDYPTYSVSHFVDRPVPLQAMAECLEGQKDASMDTNPTTFVLQGMGGCGKSQLALEYCKRARHNRTYGTIFWIDTSSSDAAIQGFTKIAEVMSKPGFKAAEAEQNLQYVRRRLDDTTKRWLLVFDNFDDPDSFRTKRLKDYFPCVGPGSILITSRQAEVRSLGNHSVEVNRLTSGEALEVLLRRTRRNPPGQDVSHATNIIERLGNHALAIDQAGAYILRRNMAFEAYLDCYNRQREKVLNETPNIWDYTKIPKNSTEGAKNCAVFTTLEMSLDSLSGDEQQQEDKKHILTLMTFFDVNRLSDRLFAPYGSANEHWFALCQDNDGWNECAFQDVLSELHNLSLLQNLDINASGAYFTIHPLVQDWLKARIGREQAKQYLIESMQVLADYLRENGADDLFKNADLHTRQFMLAHVDATILAKQEFYNSWSFLQGSSFLNVGCAYYIILAHQGRYQQAAELCGALLAGCRWTNKIGEEHLDLAAIHNLSYHLVSQGKYKEAEPLLRKCIAIDIKVHGKESLETLQSKNALTNLLIGQKKYEEADSISAEAMEVSVRVLGRDHEETTTTVNRRAEVLRYFGNHSEAVRMAKENLEISKRVRGTQNPGTLSTMKNLARCLEEMEIFEEAESLFREALSLEEERSGSDHPETLAAIYNLATNLCKQEKLIEAEELFWRAYPGYESPYGWQHPKSIRFLDWMSSCLRDLDKYEEAERIINLMPESEEKESRKQWLKERKSRMAVRDRRRY